MIGLILLLGFYKGHWVATVLNLHEYYLKSVARRLLKFGWFFLNSVVNVCCDVGHISCSKNVFKATVYPFEKIYTVSLSMWSWKKTFIYKIKFYEDVYYHPSF